MKLIDQKVQSDGKELPATGHAPKKTTNVIDLASVLKQSLKEASGAKSWCKIGTRQVCQTSQACEAAAAHQKSRLERSSAPSRSFVIPTA